jgi:hypothetical protein
MNATVISLVLLLATGTSTPDPESRGQPRARSGRLVAGIDHPVARSVKPSSGSGGLASTAAVAAPCAMLSFRPLFDAHVELAEAVTLGRTPIGERRIINILGGRFQGERLVGRIRPGGADWQIIGDDGAARLDARYTLETDGGALVQVHSQGLRHGPPEVLGRLAAGETIDPGHYYFRTVLRFETGESDLDWLNRVIGIARGARLPRAVELSAFELL